MSNKLLSALESYPVNLNNTIGLTNICIDNEDIREKILTANKIDVSTVPCVLIVYRNGSVEKYEGTSAFQWVEETVKNQLPQQPQVQQQLQQQQQQQLQQQLQQQQLQQQQQQLQQQQQQQQRTKSPNYEEYESSEEEYIPIKKSKVQKKNIQKKNIQKKSIQKKSINSTNIDELNSDSESSSEQETVSRPPVGVRTGPGNYDFTEFTESQETNRNASRHTKNSTSPATGKGNDLMSAAMAMQKEREKVDSTKPKVVGNIQTTQRPM